MNDFFYKKVDAYHIAKEYVLYVYSLLKNYPQYENHALCDQIRRAAISIPSNIAEGLGRMAVKERIHFLEIAFGSLAEVSCQLDISEALGYITAKELEEAGYNLKNRLHISKRAHLILPTHRVLDRAYEAAKGKNKVGTTGKGIGPTYSEKASRTGLRVGDILENFEEKYKTLKARHEQTLHDLNYTDYDITDEEKLWMQGIEYMRQFTLADTEIELGKALKEGKSVLAEGAQGTMLDIDHGTYPFVSSSNTVSGGVCTGLGVAPNSIGEVFGIFKAYSTRVGSGPFPVELFDETGDKIREIGHEYGAVTGRNRRCGWLDLVALRYAIMINGVTQLIMMKSDVLDGFKEIKVCTNYQKNGVVTDEMPYDTEGWEAIYETLPGWQTDLTHLTSESQFPKELKDYISYIEKATQTPITIISVGPDREQTIER